MTLRLHNFFRSSTSTRLRIVLNLKGLSYDYVPYVLRAGETRSDDYLAMNPSGFVPTLEREDGQFMSQSLSIIEWLEDTHPTPALLPTDADGRARVRALSYMIACDIHPLNNLRVLKYLGDDLGLDEAAQKTWFTRWVTDGFDALETELARSDHTGACCHGDTVSMADVCLYAQVWNNKRFQIDLAQWPVIAGIFARLDQIPAFQNASPPKQPDAA